MPSRATASSLPLVVELVDVCYVKVQDDKFGSSSSKSLKAQTHGSTEVARRATGDSNVNSASQKDELDGVKGATSVVYREGTGEPGVLNGDRGRRGNGASPLNEGRPHTDSPRRTHPQPKGVAPNATPSIMSLERLLVWLAPTQWDLQARSRVISDVSSVLAPYHLVVQPYGSTVTGLQLPSSDVDVAVMGAGENGHAVSLCSPAYMLSQSRRRRTPGGLASIGQVLRACRLFDQFFTVSHAKVPIVKCRHRSTGIPVDVSLCEDGITSSGYLCTKLKEPLHVLTRSLIILVKAFLVARGVDDPSQGGMGSYVVSLLSIFLVEAVAAKTPTVSVGKPASNGWAPPATEAHGGNQTKYGLQENLYSLLALFYQFYGIDFAYTKYGIRINPPQLVPLPSVCGGGLQIENPLDPTRNAASACTRYATTLRPVFADAFRCLSAEPPEIAKIYHIEGIKRNYEERAARKLPPAPTPDNGNTSNSNTCGDARNGRTSPSRKRLRDLMES